MTLNMILPLKTDKASIQELGGKGVNLAKLARAGYPVPGGFLVTTAAYKAYVAANDLEERIQDQLTRVHLDDPATLQAASEAIRRWFSEGSLPPNIASALGKAYQDMANQPVAVRSSATAEDLPQMSFAGQQDTFLNVIGESSLLEAVVDCWSSLWTARAIGYRARYSIPHDDVALAVVVQEMVRAEAAGVLFTANPLSGLRTETVIDATIGLGEALVGGHVEPDHYIVDSIQNQVVSKKLGAKAIAIHAVPEGGVKTVDEMASDRQSLPDPIIMELAQLGQRVAAEYELPQDIEWAWAGGRLYLLQSRPITSLYPLPDGMGVEPLKVMASFGAVQGIVEPLMPLGQDCIRVIFAGGASLFDYKLTHETQNIVYSAGERLWANLTPVVKNSLGRKIAPRIFDLGEPTIGQAVISIWDDPRLISNTGRVRLSTLRRLTHFFPGFWLNVLRAWHDPDGRRVQLQEEMDVRLAAFQAKSETIEGSPDAFARRMALVHELFHAFPFVVPQVFTAVIAGLIPLAILNRVASHLPAANQGAEQGRTNLALEILRGLPHNVTTEMDLSLWETARVIQQDSESANCFQEASAPDLATDYLDGLLPGAAQSAIEDFMQRYGMRGVGEIDIGHSRWREDPTPILQTIQSYLRIEDKDQAPSAVFKRGEQASQRASIQLETSVRRTPGGFLKARLVRWATYRLRALAGLRESPKFYIIRVMGVIRQGLLDEGGKLAAAGVIERPDDLFFLYITELEALSKALRTIEGQGAEGVHIGSRDLKTLIGKRRNIYHQEMLRNQIPRLLLSDGRAFYEGLRAPPETGDNLIVGSPVSPGVVEGDVRVVLDPNETKLEPGEILVCPGTDPAWTPLFLAAGGLVMEIGGLVTHGSVVAREYGIPAVVGVHQATTRLKTGQRIRVDGSTGQIEVIFD